MGTEKIVDKVTLDNIAVNSTSSQEKLDNSARTERAPERIVDKIEAVKNNQLNNVEVATTPVVQQVSQAQSFQQKRLIEIDNILSEGLHDVFLQMKPDKQQIFKKTGEETVFKINELFSQGKVKLSKLVELIRRWLKLVPGVNRFFLEQEAKIKADRIMELKNK